MSVSGTNDERIARVAGEQRGRIATRQLRQIAVGPAATHRRVARGTLLPEHRGVYVVGHAADIPLGRETGALLAVPQALGLSHASAARVWGIPVPGRPSRRVDVLVDDGTTSRLPGIATHRSRLVTRDDVRTRSGLSLVLPAIVLLQLAAELRAEALGAAFDEALIGRLVRPAEIQALLARARGCPGTPALRALVQREASPALTRSGGERRLLQLIRQARLPEPLVNARVHGFTVDFYWPAHGLVVELDGGPFHATRRKTERDRRKDQVLRAHGLPPLRITGYQLKDEPYLAVALIARGLTQGTPTPGTPTPGATTPGTLTPGTLTQNTTTQNSGS